MISPPETTLASRPGYALWLQRAELAFGALAGSLLAAMVLLVTIDVVGRYFFNRPLPGGFELNELAMGLMVFASLPVVTLRRQQVGVDLLAGLVPDAWRGMQAAVTDIAAAACMGVVAWQMWVKASHLGAAGETTAVLGIAVAPLVTVMAALASATVLLMLLLAWGDATGSIGAGSD